MGSEDRELDKIVNSICSCGGAGPDDARACPACRMYHKIYALRALVEAQGKVVEAARAACAEDDECALELAKINPEKYGRGSAKVQALKEALLALKEAEGEK